MFGQNKEAGPILNDYGKVWTVEKPEYTTDLNKEFKAVFDIMTSPASHETVNPAIETVARYLNMHAQSGVPKEQIRAAIVIHNKASKDIMTNMVYRESYGTDNPNLLLIEQLNEAGVDIIFCGQSSHSREIPKSSTIPGVRISLSAMTALIQLQDKGYRLIKF